jgi:hypothetical protein
MVPPIRAELAQAKGDARDIGGTASGWADLEVSLGSGDHFLLETA